MQATNSKSVSSAFTIATSVYEGPLGVLLDLIEGRKLLINEISLASIAEEFIAFTKKKDTLPIDEIAEFLRIASTLLLIKSKSLLPALELTEEEESDVEDLKRRLELHQHAREAARALSVLFGKQVSIQREAKSPTIFFSPGSDFTIEAITKNVKEVLNRTEEAKKPLPETSVQKVMTLEETMDKLSLRVQSALTLSFFQFSGEAKERVEKIVSFLALLELIKQGLVDVHQHEHFADIRITHTHVSTPRYEV